MPIAMSLRTSEDWRSARIARRYMLQTILTPNAATATTIILGLQKTAALPDCYISRIRVHVWNTGTTTAVTPLGWKRATVVAAGSAVTASDIPKVDSAAADATLVVRTGAVTASTRANQYLLTHQAQTLVGPAASTGGGFLDDWTARDLSERIRLTGAEALTLELQAGGDVDTRYHVLVVWEEVS